MDFTTTYTAKLTGISRRSVTHIYGLFRDKIRQWFWQETPFTGTIEVDESYFGPQGSGKHGRGHRVKPLYSEYSNVMAKCTPKCPRCTQKTLKDIIRGKVALESLIHSDSWWGYNGLVDVGYDPHYWVDHGNNEFAHGRPTSMA